MNNAITINKTYKIVLLIILFLSVLQRVYWLLFTDFSLLYLISLSLQITTIIMILIGSKHLKLLIKIGFGLTILGGTLQFLSKLLYLIDGAYDKISITGVIENIILFLICIPIYLGADKYIKTVNDKVVTNPFIPLSESQD